MEEDDDYDEYGGGYETEEPSPEPAVQMNPQDDQMIVGLQKFADLFRRNSDSKKEIEEIVSSVFHVFFIPDVVIQAPFCLTGPDSRRKNNAVVNLHPTHWLFAHTHVFDDPKHAQILTILRYVVDRAGRENRLTDLLTMQFLHNKTNALHIMFSNAGPSSPGSMLFLYILQKWSTVDATRLVCMQNSSGDTLLHLLVRASNLSMISVLWQRIPETMAIACNTDFAITPLWYAVQTGQESYIKQTVAVFSRKMLDAVKASILKIIISEYTDSDYKLSLKKSLATLSISTPRF